MAGRSRSTADWRGWRVVRGGLRVSRGVRRFDLGSSGHHGRDLVCGAYWSTLATSSAHSEQSGQSPSPNPSFCDQVPFVNAMLRPHNACRLPPSRTACLGPTGSGLDVPETAAGPLRLTGPGLISSKPAINTMRKCYWDCRGRRALPGRPIPADDQFRGPVVHRAHDAKMSAKTGQARTTSHSEGHAAAARSFESRSRTPAPSPAAGQAGTATRHTYRSFGDGVA